MNPCREHVKRKPLDQGRFTHESLPRVRQRNLSAKEEFTYVNPCRETVKENLSAKIDSPKWILAESALRKPLGQGRFTQMNPCREHVKRKPLGQGRFTHESLPRVRQRNLSAKEEFTYVNTYRETVKENLSAKVDSPKWIPAKSTLKKPLGQGRFTQVNPCQECIKETTRPRSIHPNESLPRAR